VETKEVKAMTVTERGKVQDGGIVLVKPVPLPEGTEVVVHIEPVQAPEGRGGRQPAEAFTALPFFGMWAARQDLQDSAAHVRKERERWHHRAQRTD
jgi:hypothetical protein